jgi:hypothetical protein
VQEAKSRESKMSLQSCQCSHDYFQEYREVPQLQNIKSLSTLEHENKGTNNKYIFSFDEWLVTGANSLRAVPVWPRKAAALKTRRRFVD